ncbi:flagellar filament capping protein FliD [Oxalobacteraceae bacterium A2-2]
MATTSIIGSTSGSTSGSTASSATTTEIYNRVQAQLVKQSAGATKLNAAYTRDQTRLSGLGQLQSALSSFQSLAAGLSGSGLSTTASSSAASVLTPSVTGSAKAGSYAVDVQQLAQGQFLTSDGFAAKDAAIGAGTATTVKIEFGTAGKSFDPNGSAKTITLDSGNNTLEGIAAAFKAAGVDAAVVKSGDGYALTLAGASGADNSMRITVSGDAALKDALAYNPDGKQNMVQSQAARDALLTVDGKTVISGTNTVSSAIEGVTLALASAGKSTVAIGQDSGKTGDGVKSFIAAYNTLNTKLQALKKGDLQSDTALNQVGNQLNLLVKSNATALAKVGVTVDASGALALDEKKLQGALAADAPAVATLFVNNGKGLADQLGSKVAAFTADNSIISREKTSTSKELATLTTKRAAMSKALTAQANALVALYTQQAQSGSSGSGGVSSLFDMIG